MKRFLCFTLIFSLLLSGCTVFGERFKEPVTFYYLRSDYQYFVEDGVILSEQKEASGHRNDLSYLMALYLMGPSDEDLISPLPRGTRCYSIKHEDSGITIHLSDTNGQITDISFTLACSCLSLTFFELTDAETVIINSGERSVSMSRNNMILYDSGTTAVLEE